MKRSTSVVAFIALVCVVVIALAIFEGNRLYRSSSQMQDSAAAQAQGAQSGGSSTTYH